MTQGACQSQVLVLRKAAGSPQTLHGNCARGRNRGGGLNDDDEILDPPRLVLLIYEASSLLPKRLSLVFDSLE